MSRPEFKKSFYTEERNRKISEKHMGVSCSEQHKAAMRLSRIGRKLSESHKAHIGDSVRGERNGNFGKVFSDEMRKRMSEAQRGKVISEETKMKLRQANSGSNHPQYGKHKSEITKQKIRIAAVNQKQVQKDTGIEKIMEVELIKRGIPFIKQASVENIARPDFLIFDKVIIECDGDYWHNYPYGTIEDKTRDKKLNMLGYAIHRFWERDIHQDVSACVDRVLNTISVNTVVKEPSMLIA
jgi:very-short-patch-repair endonuclease